MARTNLGRIRTVFKGEWTAVSYVVDDVVLYGGSAYTCIAIAAAGNDPTDTAFWVKSVGGVEFTGAWDTAVAYKVDQIVTSEGSSFIAISNNTGTQPVVSGNAAWILFAAGGNIADQTGNAGKVLGTDGTSTSWVASNPDQTGQANKVLKTNGSVTSWTNVGVTELGISDGSDGDFLSTDGSGTLSFATPTGGGGSCELLGSCYSNSQWNGQVCIPPEKRGMFARYKVMGVTCCHQYYCSTLAMRFAGANGDSVGQIKSTNDCACNDMATYCCAHASCGSMNQWKCFDASETWACAGLLYNVNGCGSGCATACANYGYAWEFNLYPYNPCNGTDMDSRMARFFNRRDGGVGGDSMDCCGFFHNVGRIWPCCGSHTGCLQSMCWGTQSGSTSVYGKGSIHIFGMDRITTANTDGNGTSWVKPAVPGDRNW
jgi:hypothetical protein